MVLSKVTTRVVSAKGILQVNKFIVKGLCVHDWVIAKKVFNYKENMMCYSCIFGNWGMNRK